jgi:alpha-glucosidase (family GH31 glycosyl hydrolase)
MVIDHPQNANAWKYDLQYMWGESMLIAPNCADSGSVQLWLPKASGSICGVMNA